MYNETINNGLKEAIGNRNMRQCLMTNPQLFLEQVGIIFKYGPVPSNLDVSKTKDNVMFGAYRP